MPVEAPTCRSELSAAVARGTCDDSSRAYAAAVVGWIDAPKPRPRTNSTMPSRAYGVSSVTNANGSVARLEARYLHAGADLPVALPVETDEDVALSQIGAVERPGRMWPRPELEHHRRQPQRRNRQGDGPPLLGQLFER